MRLPARVCVRMLVRDSIIIEDSFVYPSQWLGPRALRQRCPFGHCDPLSRVRGEWSCLLCIKWATCPFIHKCIYNGRPWAPFIRGVGVGGIRGPAHLETLTPPRPPPFTREEEAGGWRGDQQPVCTGLGVHGGGGERRRKRRGEEKEGALDVQYLCTEGLCNRWVYT